jgi:Ca2+-binding RTX toxin-like protein
VFTITQKVTSGIRIDSATASQGSCTVNSSTSATCNLGLIAADQTVTGTFHMTATQVGTQTVTLRLCGAVEGCQEASETVVVTDTTGGPPGGGNEECAFSNPTIVGTSASESINGTSGPDLICGMGGNDQINGLGGNDSLHGGSGDDILDGRGDAARDRLHGGDGYDVCYGNRKPKDIMSGCEEKIR